MDGWMDGCEDGGSGGEKERRRGVCAEFMF